MHLRQHQASRCLKEKFWPMVLVAGAAISHDEDLGCLTRGTRYRLSAVQEPGEGQTTPGFLTEIDRGASPP